MVKTLKISDKTHKLLSEYKDKEEIKTFDGAIRVLILGEDNAKK